MAEGFANSIKSDKLIACSAGTKKHGINPRAVQVMKEIGIDISSNQSNTTDELPEQNFDIVFTVCSDAHENCPYFSGGQIIHVGFEDPPRLTAEMTDEEEILKIYRRVRDEIKNFVNNIEIYFGE